jgi:hypothetical protein
MRAFLEAFSAHGNITLAAKQVDIHRETVLDWRRKSDGEPVDPDYCIEVEREAGQAAELVPFCQAFAGCEGIARDILVAEAWRRAVDGWEEPVFQKGEEVGRVRKFDSLLLMFLIKQRDPSFREGFKVDVSHSGVVEIESARDRLAARLEGLLDARLGPGQAPIGALESGGVAGVIDVSPIGESSADPEHIVAKIK